MCPAEAAGGCQSARWGQSPLRGKQRSSADSTVQPLDPVAQMGPGLCLQSECLPFQSCRIKYSATAVFLPLCD